MNDDSVISDAESRIRAELGSNEELHWAGRPYQGFVIRRREWINIPLTLLWWSFFIFWEVMVLRKGAPIMFPIIGALFICCGLYVTVGRFWGDAYERSRTYYGVTNKRVIIIWGLLWRSVRSIPLQQLEDVLFVNDVHGTTTIRFIRKWSIASTFLGDRWNPYRMPGTPQFETYVPPTFEMIEDAQTVIDVIQKAWDDARSFAVNQNASPR